MQEMQKNQEKAWKVTAHLFFLCWTADYCSLQKILHFLRWDILGDSGGYDCNDGDDCENVDDYDESLRELTRRNELTRHVGNPYKTPAAQMILLNHYWCRYTMWHKETCYSVYNRAKAP